MFKKIWKYCKEDFICLCLWAFCIILDIVELIMNFRAEALSLFLAHLCLVIAHIRFVAMKVDNYHDDIPF